MKASIASYFYQQIIRSESGRLSLENLKKITKIFFSLSSYDHLIRILDISDTYKTVSKSSCLFAKMQICRPMRLLIVLSLFAIARSKYLLLKLYENAEMIQNRGKKNTIRYKQECVFNLTKFLFDSMNIHFAYFNLQTHRFLNPIQLRTGNLQKNFKVLTCFTLFSH